MKAFGLLILACGITSLQSEAQTKITLQAAIDTALKNNLTIQNQELKTRYQQAIIKTSAFIPQTNIAFEYGQINSAYNDNRLSLSQSLNFPTVYSNQKKVYEAEWQYALLNKTLQQQDIKKSSNTNFLCIPYTKRKKKRKIITKSR